MNDDVLPAKKKYRFGWYSYSFLILWLIAISYNAVVWKSYGYEIYELSVRAYPNLFIFPFLLILSLVNIRPALRFLKNYSAKKIASRNPHIEKFVWAFIFLMSVLITCAETMNSGAVWMINKKDVKQAIAFSEKTHIDFLSLIVSENAYDPKVISELYACQKADTQGECLISNELDKILVSTQSGKCSFKNEGGETIELSNDGLSPDLNITSLNDRKKLAHCRLVNDSNNSDRNWSNYYYYFSFFCFVFIIGTILTISTITGIASWKVKPEVYPSEDDTGLTSEEKLMYINGCAILSILLLLFWIIMRIASTENFSLVYPNGISKVINSLFIFQYFLVIVILLLGVFKSEQLLQKLIIGISGLAASFYAIVHSERIAEIFETIFVTHFNLLTILIFVIFLSLISLIPASIMFFFSIPLENEPET